jgi:hypothetical protein
MFETSGHEMNCYTLQKLEAAWYAGAIASDCMQGWVAR